MELKKCFLFSLLVCFCLLFLLLEFGGNWNVYILTEVNKVHRYVPSWSMDNLPEPKPKTNYASDKFKLSSTLIRRQNSTTKSSPKPTSISPTKGGRTAISSKSASTSPKSTTAKAEVLSTKASLKATSSATKGGGKTLTLAPTAETKVVLTKSTPKASTAAIVATRQSKTRQTSEPRHATTIRQSSMTSGTSKATTLTAKTALTENTQRKYVCANKVGGLGNNIFQFATTFGVAHSKDMTAVVQKGGHIDSVFNLTSTRWLAVTRNVGSLCKDATGRGESLASGFDPNLIKFSPDKSYRLGTYLQSWRYFNASIPELRKQLVFKSHIQKKANSIIQNVMTKFGVRWRNNVTLISVHIRRGDMVKNNFGYEVATKEYIEKAVQYFSNITNRIFIVCSNDLKWSKQNMPSNEKVEFVAGTQREVDLAILSSCDHIITTVGSFSWWAGFFNKGTVLYYKWPARENSRLRQAYSKDYSDYFMPHWIGL